VNASVKVDERARNLLLGAREKPRTKLGIGGAGVVARAGSRRPGAVCNMDDADDRVIDCMPRRRADLPPRTDELRPRREQE
jgi:hypothetical protein